MPSNRIDSQLDVSLPCPPGWAAVLCPLCGGVPLPFLSSQGHYFSSTDVVTLERCACGLVLTNPQPQEAALAAFYDVPTYYTHAARGGLLAALRRRWQRLQMRGTLMRLRLGVENHSNHSRFAKRNAPGVFSLPGGLSFLDFGCGDGQWVHLAADLGLDAVGVEPDPRARQSAATRGINVVASLDELDGRYDRILVRHVLEHLPEPLQTLQALAERLLPTGRMLISTPNVLSRQAEVFGGYWLGYDLPRHLWHFSGDTLRRLAELANLRVLHLQSVELANFARISARRMAQQTGRATAYDAGDVNELEAAGLGAELVMVVDRTTV